MSEPAQAAAGRPVGWRKGRYAASLVAGGAVLGFLALGVLGAGPALLRAGVLSIEPATMGVSQIALALSSAAAFLLAVGLGLGAMGRKSRAVIVGIVGLTAMGMLGFRLYAYDEQHASLPPIHDVQTDWSRPVAFSESAQRGQQLFGTNSDPGIGCFTCHTPLMKTPAAIKSAALSNKDVRLYSDLLIHHMGPGLADKITQGAATGDMFRSAPLWGVGQRIFFLHDGRTTDLREAILAHKSNGNDDFPDSEANEVIGKFKDLSNQKQQQILDFLRSL